MPEKTEKTRNAARIVRTIWTHPNISRFEIAEQLGLEKSTITHQVNRLLNLGLVTEIAEGKASPNGGRRPIELAINKDYGFVIGIEMQFEAYSAVAVNLAGEILRFKKVNRITRAERFIDDLIEIALAFSDELGGVDRLLGVGVGIGGLIDSEQGIVHFSIPLRLDGPLDFSRLVALRSHIPFLIGNDANCCAWGELAFHKVNSHKNFLFCLMQFRKGEEAQLDSGGVGVGFGIVIDGKVFTGADFTAGEFRSAFWDQNERSQFSVSPEELKDVTEKPELLESLVRELSRNIAMVVNTLDLNKVFIGGDVENYSVDFPRILDEEIAKNRMYPTAMRCEASYSSLGDRAVSYGAAGMLLYRIFTSSHLPLDDAKEGDPLARILKL